MIWKNGPMSSVQSRWGYPGRQSQRSMKLPGINLQTVWSMGRRFTFREEITGFAMVWMCFAAESVVEDRSFLTCNYQSGEKEKDR